MGVAILKGKGRPVVKYMDTLRSSVQKRLNRSICRLGCALGWAEGSKCYMMGMRHLANTTEPCVCGGDAALCQITMTTCYY